MWLIFLPVNISERESRWSECWCLILEKVAPTRPDLTFKATAITTAGPSSTLENQTRKIYLPSSRLTLNLPAHLHMHWIPEGFNKEAQKLSMRVKCKLELRWGCKCESLQIKYPTQMWPAVPSVTFRIHLKHSSFPPHSSAFGEKKEGRNCHLGDCPPSLSLCLSLSLHFFFLSFHFLHHFLSFLLPWSLRSSYILPLLWHLFLLCLFFVCTLSFRGYKMYSTSTFQQHSSLRILTAIMAAKLF